MAAHASFEELARDPGAPLAPLTLAIAAAFHEVDTDAAIAELDALGAELARATARLADPGPAAQTRAVAHLLGAVHGFDGDRQRYDDPRNSMLDLVLRRRRGLPILLSVVYVEVARRAGIALAGVGLPGHFVVGHFGADPAVLIDPFAGGEPVAGVLADATVRAWPAPEVALRILNNLVAAFQRRGNVGAAIQAAQMRLVLPAPEPLRTTLEDELRRLRANLN